jgi:hypothetical protein
MEKRLKEKDVIRWALRVLSEHIYTSYDRDEELRDDDKRYVAKIEKMLPKYNG